MYKLTIEVSTLKEMQQIVASMGRNTPPIAQPTAEVVADPKPKKARAEPKAEVVEKVEKETTEEGAPDFAACKDKMLALAQKHGREATLSILGKFEDIKGAPATRVTALQEKDYAQFMEDAQAALDADEVSED